MLCLQYYDFPEGNFIEGNFIEFIEGNFKIKISWLLNIKHFMYTYVFLYESTKFLINT